MANTLYESKHQPDLTDAKQLMAFLLMPADGFLHYGVGEAVTTALLDGIKRAALKAWYARREVVR